MVDATSKYVNIYVTLVLSFVGIVGNVLTAVVVVRSKELWKKTTSLYVLVLAILDSSALLFAALDKSFAAFNLNIDDYISYKLSLFWDSYPSELEAWVLVNMAIERFCAVFYPFKVRILFTKARAYVSLILFALGLFVYHIVYFVSSAIHGNNDKDSPFEQKSFQHRVVYHVFIARAVPFLILAITSLAIIIKVMKRNRLGSASQIKLSRMTVMLSAVVMGFLITTGPHMIVLFLVVHGYGEVLSADDYTLTLCYFNYVINVYIYSVCNSMFRQELVNIFRNRCRK